MKNLFILIFFNFVLVILSSCDEVLNRFEYQDTNIANSSKEPQLCVQGFPSDYGEGLKIDVSEAWDINKGYYNNDIAINNAVVSLFENGEKICTLNSYLPSASPGVEKKFPNYFHPDVILKPGKDYEIEVSSVGYKTVKGKTSIPISVKPDSLIAIESVENNKKGYQFTLYFTDPSNSQNFYMVNARNWMLLNHRGNTTQTIDNIKIPLGDHIFDFLPDNQSFVREPFDISTYKPRMFSDETIVGRQYGLKFFLELNSFIDTNDVYVDKVEVLLMSISKEMYDGLKSQYLFQLIKSDLYAEKMTIYSNMSNGIGLWGGYSVTSVTLKMNKKVNFQVYQ